MKEQQIEEIAKIFCGMKNGCDGCMWDKVHCNERNYAEEIYNAGYRKQSEPISCDHEKGLILTIDGASGYFPKEFIIEAIKTHMSQSKGEWISVEERLPDTQEEVLTYSKCNGVRSACLLCVKDDIKTWFLYQNEKLSISVTHWMPLPEAPKGGEE